MNKFVLSSSGRYLSAKPAFQYWVTVSCVVFTMGSLLLAGCTGNGTGGDGDGDGDMDTNGPPPVVGKTVEIGFTDLNTNEYMTLDDGDTMPLFTALQGGSHVFVTIRLTGFPVVPESRTSVIINETIRVVETDSVIHDFGQLVNFDPIDEDTLELASRFMFLSAQANVLHNQLVEIEITVTDAVDADSSASIQQSLLLELE